LVLCPLLGQAIVGTMHSKVLERFRKVCDLGDVAEPLNILFKGAPDHFAVEEAIPKRHACSLFNVCADKAKISRVELILPRSHEHVEVENMLYELRREVQ
jgi:hypothetical protein